MARVVTFKADPSLLEALDKFAREKRVARSVVIRDALVAFLKARGVRIVDVNACMAVQRAASEYVGRVRAELPYPSPTLMSVLEGMVREILRALGCTSPASP